MHNITQICSEQLVSNAFKCLTLLSEPNSRHYWRLSEFESLILEHGIYRISGTVWFHHRSLDGDFRGIDYWLQ